MKLDFSQFDKHFNKILSREHVITMPDTSFIMEPTFEEFLKRFLPMLGLHNKTMIIAYSVLLELQKHAKGPDDEKKRTAKQRLLLLDRVMKTNPTAILIGGKDSDGLFFDKVLFQMFYKFITTHHFLVLSCDGHLIQDLTAAYRGTTSIKYKKSFSYFNLMTQKLETLYESEYVPKTPKTVSNAAKLTVRPKSKQPFAFDDMKFSKEDGELITLERKVLGGGATAKLFRIRGDESRIAKIFHPSIGEKEYLETLDRISRIKGLAHENIAFPDTLLFDKNGQPVGFLMKRCRGQTLHTIINSEVLPMEEKLSICKQIFQALSFLHVHSLHVTDLRLDNLIYDATMKQVYIIDTDGLDQKVNNYLYDPPSRLALNADKEDVFRAVTLCCQIILQKHPFLNQKGSIRENIDRLSFSYGGEKGSFQKNLFLRLSNQLQTAFVKTLKCGQVADVEEWITVFDDELSNRNSYEATASTQGNSRFFKWLFT